MNKEKKAKSNTGFGKMVQNLNKKFLSKLRLVLIMDREKICVKRNKNSIAFEGTDFIRLNSLELLSDEIKRKKLKGAVAELGVFRGGFSKLINKSFPEKTLYLYDTFEGFDDKDVKKENEKGFSPSREDFSNTSVNYVLNKMPYKNKCMVRKGFFPSTAEQDAKETFCFVSIDADLYKPTLEGLKFFYPRLEKGGFIMVHDYLNLKYEGTKEAVQEFAEKIIFLL